MTLHSRNRLVHRVKNTISYKVKNSSFKMQLLQNLIFIEFHKNFMPVHRIFQNPTRGISYNFIDFTAF